VARATPDNVGRRVVVTWEGNPIWFRKTKTGLRWHVYVLTREQDQALRSLTRGGGLMRKR